MAMNLNDITNVSIHGVGYRCINLKIIKIEVNDLLRNAYLSKKNRT